MAANTQTNRKIVKQPEMAKHPVFFFFLVSSPLFCPAFKREVQPLYYAISCTGYQVKTLYSIIAKRKFCSCFQSIAEINKTDHEPHHAND